MKHIKLTKGKFAIVDDSDYELLNQYKWHLSNKGYAVRGEYRDFDKKLKKYKHRKLLFMHKELLSCPKGKQVDHVNRNRLDNRRENLRIASYLEQARNASLRKDNKYGFKGVYFYRNPRFRFKKYWAYIRVNKKLTSLGYYKTLEEAAKAYDVAAKKYFGEFSKLNYAP